MMSLKIVMLSVAVLALTTVDAVAGTWICDSKAAAGFDSKRGYEVIQYSSDTSYRIKSHIDKENISLPFLRGDSIFSEAKDSGRRAASIERIGLDFTGLCIMVDYTQQITCNYSMPFGTDFELSLETGRYTMLAGGYEDGETSWVEVGECRRIN